MFSVLWTIAVILFVLWLFGVLFFHTVGALIHILLVLAILVVVYNLVMANRRRTL